MKPVILIPGFGGSVLVRKGSEMYKPHPLSNPIIDNRWVNLSILVAPPNKRWHDDMNYSIDYQKEANGNLTVCGLKGIPKDLIPYDIGGTKGIKDLVPEFQYLKRSYKEKLNNAFYYRYFHDICDALYSKGYEDKNSLIGVPYDFRLVLDPIYRQGLFADFAKFLTKSTELKKEKAIVVTHSLGGLLFKWFLTTYPYYQSMVHTWVSISTPFGGAHYPLKAALCGDHYMPVFKQCVKDELARNTGIIMCFPNSLAYKDDEPLAYVAQPEQTITLASFDKLAQQHVKPFQLWRDLYKPYIPIISQPISVNTVIVVGSGNNTPTVFHMTSLGEEPCTLKRGIGDGIIEDKSLMVYDKVFSGCKSLKKLHLDGRDHTSPLMDATVIKLILDLAMEENK